MPVHQVISVDQAGDIGGEGVSRFSFRNIGGSPASQGELDGAMVYLHDMFTAVQGLIPAAVTHTLQPEVPVVDDESGQNVQFLSATAGLAPVSGLGIAATYAAGSGSRVTLHTGTVHNGRVIRGAFYLVPLDSNAFGSSGGLTAAAQATIANAVNTYVSNMRNAPHPAVVYHRPATGTLTGGLAADVLNAVVPGKPTSLRSRRS